MGLIPSSATRVGMWLRPLPLALEIDPGRAPVPGWAVSISSRTFGGVSHRTVFFSAGWAESIGCWLRANDSHLAPLRGKAHLWMQSVLWRDVSFESLDLMEAKPRRPLDFLDMCARKFSFCLAWFEFSFLLLATKRVLIHWGILEKQAGS